MKREKVTKMASQRLRSHRQTTEQQQHNRRWHRDKCSPAQIVHTIRKNSLGFKFGKCWLSGMQWSITWKCTELTEVKRRTRRAHFAEMRQSNVSYARYKLFSCSFLFLFSEKLFSLFSRRWFELISLYSSLFLFSLCLSFVLQYKLEILKCIRKNVCALRTSRKVSMRRKLRKECARSERRSLKHGHPRIVLPFQTISKCMRRIHRYSR